MTQHTSRVSHFFSLVRRSLRGDEHDYTQGSIKTAILLLAVPMILELSLESVFAVVDMFFVGKLGENAIATVGLTESVIAIVYSIAIGLSTGATAMIARRTGEKDPDGAAHAAIQVIILALVIITITSILGAVYAPNILSMMGAKAEVIEQGAIYTRIMFGGSMGITLLFLINGVFRGAGNAAIAMKSLWLASFINIVLCPILIYGLGPITGMGLKGAAIATTIGRGTGVCYQFYHLFKGERFKFKRSHFNIDIPVIKSLVGISWPATLQFFIGSGSWIFLSRLVAESGGTSASAGYQIAIRNVVFFILPAWGLSNAAATLVGQNLGANQPERAERSVLLTTKYNALFMGGVMLLFLFFSAPIISIFTKDPSVHHTGTLALQIIGAGYVFYGIGMVMIQSLNGAGDTKTPTWINIVGFWIVQIPLAYLLAKSLNWGPTGVFVAIPFAETVMAVASFIYFKKGKWKEVKV